jgi:hypothetical protein
MQTNGFDLLNGMFVIRLRTRSHIPWPNKLTRMDQDPLKLDKI